MKRTIVLLTIMLILGNVTPSYSSSKPIEIKNVAISKNSKTAYFILQWNNPYPMPPYDADNYDISLELIIEGNLNNFKIDFVTPIKTSLTHEVLANLTFWAFDRLNGMRSDGSLARR